MFLPGDPQLCFLIALAVPACSSQISYKETIIIFFFVSYNDEKWKTGNASVVNVSRVAEFCRFFVFFFVHSAICRHRHFVVDLILTVSHIRGLVDYKNLRMTSGEWFFNKGAGCGIAFCYKNIHHHRLTMY